MFSSMWSCIAGTDYGNNMSQHGMTHKGKHYHQTQNNNGNTVDPMGMSIMEQKSFEIKEQHEHGVGE